MGTKSFMIYLEKRCQSSLVHKLWKSTPKVRFPQNSTFLIVFFHLSRFLELKVEWNLIQYSQISLHSQALISKFDPNFILLKSSFPSKICNVLLSQNKPYALKLQNLNFRKTKGGESTHTVIPSFYSFISLSKFFRL